MSQPSMTAKDVFLAAIEKDTGLRDAFLDDACAGDVVLRQQVDALLRVHDEPDSLLDRPRIELGMPAKRAAGEAGCGERPVFEQVGDSIGPYKLRERIGEGGFGVVYRAEQTKPIRRQVALKIIKPGMDTREVIARFAAERQALAMMDHAHIAKVFDAGTTETRRPYFAMELVEGVPITDYCDGCNLNTCERLELFTTVCQAVQHAHQKGVIHRDIKPTNVLVTMQDGRPAPKVIDFGVAKAIEQPLTEHSLVTAFAQVVGTPLYMSPEQAELRPLGVDTRSDIYSLGVMLYELLTGVTPFDRQRLKSVPHDEVRRIIREEEPPRPSARVSTLDADIATTLIETHRLTSRQLANQLRGELDWIVMKALAKDRTLRYASASSLADDIERFLQHKPIEARPPSAIYQIRKFAKRNKTAMAAFSVVSIVLLAASAISTLSAMRAIRAERLATDRLSQVEHERNEKELARQDAVEHQAIAEEARQAAEERRNEAMWNLYVARQYPIVDAWKRDDFGHLDGMLDELLPDKGQPDFRGWEWAFFRDQCDQAFVTVSGVWPAWHPSQSLLATVVGPSGPGAYVGLWTPEDRATPRVLSRIPSEIAARIQGLRWSGDGSRLAYATADGLAVVLDATTGEQVLELPAYSNEEKFAQLHAFDLSADGTILATSKFIGQVDLWDVESAQRLRALPQVESQIISIRFNSNASQLGSALRFGCRVTWDVMAGEAFEYARRCLKNGSVAWNRAGTQFSATERNSFSVYELHNVEPLVTLPHRTISRACWMGDDRLVSSGYDHTIRVWDARTYELLGEHALYKFPVTELAVSSDQRLLALSAYAVNIDSPARPQPEYEQMRVVNLAEVSGETARLRPDVVQTGLRHWLKWESEGSYIASGHQQGSDNSPRRVALRIWDTLAEKLVHERIVEEAFQEGQQNALVCSLAWRPDQRAIWLTKHDGTFCEWHPEAGELKTLGKFGDNVANAESCYSPDGRLLALAEHDRVQLIDTASLEVRGSQKPGFSDLWYSTWSHDGKKIATTKYRLFTVWEPLSGKVLEPRAAGLNGGMHISSITWSPDDKALAVGLQDGPILIVDAHTLEDIATLNGHPGQVHSVDWSSNQRRIATAGDDGTVRIWDAATGHELIVLEHPEQRPYFSVAWSPDSRRLAAGDSHGEVFLWGSTKIKSLPRAARGLSTGVIARHLNQ